jgi:hypothetical protein
MSAAPFPWREVGIWIFSSSLSRFPAQYRTHFGGIRSHIMANDSSPPVESQRTAKERTSI